MVQLLVHAELVCLLADISLPDEVTTSMQEISIWVVDKQPDLEYETSVMEREERNQHLGKHYFLYKELHTP